MQGLWLGKPLNPCAGGQESTMGQSELPLSWHFFGHITGGCVDKTRDWAGLRFGTVWLFCPIVLLLHTWTQVPTEKHTGWLYLTCPGNISMPFFSFAWFYLLCNLQHHSKGKSNDKYLITKQITAKLKCNLFNLSRSRSQ